MYQHFVLFKLLNNTPFYGYGFYFLFCQLRDFWVGSTITNVMNTIQVFVCFNFFWVDTQGVELMGYIHCVSTFEELSKRFLK